MNTKLNALAEKIAYLRIKKKLTQEKLAELSNCSTNHISKLENGRTNPSFELLVNLSHALDVEIFELFQVKENKTTKQMRNELESIIKRAEDCEIKKLYNIIKSIE